jgi:hypothetical protein
MFDAHPLPRTRSAIPVDVNNPNLDGMVVVWRLCKGNVGGKIRIAAGHAILCLPVKGYLIGWTVRFGSSRAGEGTRILRN